MEASPLTDAWVSHICRVVERPSSVFCTIGWVGGHGIPLPLLQGTRGAEESPPHPSAGPRVLITTVSFAAPCEYEGKQFSLGESWLSTNCLLCTCLHPVGVGCCET